MTSWSVVVALTAALACCGCGGDPSPTGSGGAVPGEGGAGVGGNARVPLEAGPTVCQDTTSDPRNCGSCGHRCAPAQRCEEGVCVCEPGPTPSFANDVAPLLGAACANGKCHGVEAPAVGLGFADDVLDQLVNVPAFQCMNEVRYRVAPGKPDESYLIHKLNNVHLCSGSPMPPSVLLGRTHRLLISRWICAGAPDN